MAISLPPPLRGKRMFPLYLTLWERGFKEHIYKVWYVFPGMWRAQGTGIWHTLKSLSPEVAAGGASYTCTNSQQWGHSTLSEVRCFLTQTSSFPQIRGIWESLVMGVGKGACKEGEKQNVKTWKDARCKTSNPTCGKSSISNKIQSSCHFGGLNIIKAMKETI